MSIRASLWLFTSERGNCGYRESWPAWCNGRLHHHFRTCRMNVRFSKKYLATPSAWCMILKCHAKEPKCSCSWENWRPFPFRIQNLRFKEKSTRLPKNKGKHLAGFTEITPRETRKSTAAFTQNTRNRNMTKRIFRGDERCLNFARMRCTPVGELQNIVPSETPTCSESAGRMASF